MGSTTASSHAPEHPPIPMAPSPDQDRTTDNAPSIWSTMTVIGTVSGKSLTPASSLDQLPGGASTDAVYELESNRPATAASCRSNQSRKSHEQVAIEAATTLGTSGMRAAETQRAYVGEWMKYNDIQCPGWSSIQCPEQADLEWEAVVRRIHGGEEHRNRVREQRQAAREALPQEPLAFVGEFV